MTRSARGGRYKTTSTGRFLPIAICRSPTINLFVPVKESEEINQICNKKKNAHTIQWSLREKNKNYEQN